MQQRWKELGSKNAAATHRQGFGFERVFEVEVPTPDEKKVKLQASLEPWKQKKQHQQGLIGFGDWRHKGATKKILVTF